MLVRCTPTDKLRAETGVKVGGIVDRYPRANSGWSGDNLGDLFLGVKVNLLSEYRQQGVGYALFRHCVAEAARRGCARMEWTVLDWNSPAISFYERQGARHLNEWLPYRLDEAAIKRLISG